MRKKKRKKDKKEVFYFRILKPHLGKIIFAFTLLGLSTALSFIETHLLSKCIDNITTPHFYIPIIKWVIIGIIVSIFSFSANKLIVVEKSKINKKIREAILSVIGASTIESVEKNSSAELAKITLDEPNTLLESMHNLSKVVFKIILGVFSIIYILFNCQKIFIFIIFTFLTIFIIEYFTIKKMVEAQGEAKDSAITTTSIVIEGFNAFKTIKVQKLYKFKKYILESIKKETEKKVKSDLVFSKNDIILNTINVISNALFFLLSGYLITKNEISFGIFTSIYLYKKNIDELVHCIFKITKEASTIKTTIRKINEITKNKIIQPEKWGPVYIKNPAGKIDIQDLTIERNGRNILDNINISIPPNRFVGVVGESGCGKTTLLDALAKAISPTSGQILLDGIPLKNLTEHSYNSLITFAPQFLPDFNLTIYQNLTLAQNSSKKINDDKIIEALKKCGAYDFVMQMGGLHAKPSRLSGGQIQKLALTRLVLNAKKIILLDESTSALDANSQEKILELIDLAREDHTIIFVAHRLNCLKNADVIYFMKNGKIVDYGRYKELCKRNKEFNLMAENS